MKRFRDLKVLSVLRIAAAAGLVVFVSAAGINAGVETNEQANRKQAAQQPARQQTQQPHQQAQQPRQQAQQPARQQAQQPRQQAQQPRQQQAPQQRPAQQQQPQARQQQAPQQKPAQQPAPQARQQQQPNPNQAQPTRQTPATTGNAGIPNRPNQPVPTNRPTEQQQPTANVQQGQGRQGQPGQQQAGRSGGQQPLPGQQFGRGAGQQGQPGQQFGRNGGQNAAQPGFKPRPNVAVEPGRGGRQIVHAPNGSQVQLAGGRVAEVRTPGGTVIHHAPDGTRRVEMTRPGGGRVVMNGPGRGYVQRNLNIGNRQFVERTEMDRGGMFTHVYRPYAYRSGVLLDIYTPDRYYRPGFYAWAYNPWARPVFYTSWGWAGTPWFGFYAGYFAPYPYYPGPAFWLTDYLISDTLQQAYLDQMAANYAAYPRSTITPDVKRAIADEVTRQLREEQAEAQAGGVAANTDPFPGNTPHVFLANASAEAYYGDGTCMIGAGDVLEMRGVPAPDATAANVLVRASRGGCPSGATVSVGLQDLAEIQNNMREVIERGLGELQAKQGQGGLPALTGEAAAPPAPVSWASQIQPDPGVQNALNQASAEANAAEQGAVSGALSQPAGEVSPAGPAPTIHLGSCLDDVVAAFGQPLRIVDMDEKKIYIYKDVKITLQNGFVTDVQ